MPVFRIKRKYIEALKNGRKRAELRVGNMWFKIAQKIQRGELKPIAIFKSGDEILTYEIYRIETYPNAIKALKSKRWKILGLDAKNLRDAVEEIKRMYPRLPLKPAVLFWIRPARRNYGRIVNLEILRTREKISKSIKINDKQRELEREDQHR